MIKKEYIFSLKSSEKNDALKEIASFAKKVKLTDSAEEVLKTLQDREKEFSTGFENGFAIPHGRSSVIKEPAILFAKSKEGIDWKSMDKKPSKYFFILLIPTKASKQHIKMLSLLSQALLEKSFTDVIKNGSSAKILDIIQKTITNKLDVKKDSKEVPSKKDGEKIVAITACAIGIAHTYMAAKKLEEVGREKGFSVRVQKNGASGPEDRLTEKEIEEASYVILANDVTVDERPFVGKKIVRVPVKYAIKEPADIYDNLEKEAVLYNNDEIVRKSKGDKKKKNEGSWIYRNILKHVMEGISMMIPFLIAAGILLGIGKLLASFTGDIAIADNWQKLALEHGTTNYWFKIVYFINIMGIVCLWVIFPVFGLGTARSIGGKLAIMPGFIVGLLADGDHLLARIWRTFNDVDPANNPFLKDTYPFIQSSAGFFGVLIGSILAGYFIAFLNRKIKIRGLLAPMKPILVIPAIAVITIILGQTFIINPPFALLNDGIQKLAKSSQNFALIYSVIIAACTALDLGGPINKAAGAVAAGLVVQGFLPSTSRMLAIVVPPIGLGLATVIGPFLLKKKNLYDEDLKIAGRTSIFLGFIAISEGGLPFLFKNPITTIISSITGAVAGAVFVWALQIHAWVAQPAFYGWALVGTKHAQVQMSSFMPVWGQILFYVVAVLGSALIVAFVDISLRLYNGSEKARTKAFLNKIGFKKLIEKKGAKANAEKTK